MAVGNIYEAQINLNGPEGVWSFSFGYKQIDGANGPDTLERLALAMQPLFDPAFLNILGHNHVIESIEVAQVDTGDDIPGIAAFPDGIGNVQETALPDGAPLLVNWKTIAPNAKFNGKSYVSGVPVTYVTNGLITSNALPFIQTWVDGMIVDIQLTGGENAEFTPVVISRYEDGVKRTQPIGYEIEFGSVNGAIKNQRRRRTKNKGIPFA